MSDVEQDIIAKNVRQSARMFFCSVGLDTPVTASDSVKTKVIGFIESHREMKVTTRTSWNELDTKERSSLLRNLNLSWSKAFKTWRLCFADLLCGLPQSH
jgi:hypothetical protein